MKFDEFNIKIDGETGYLSWDDGGNNVWEAKSDNKAGSISLGSNDCPDPIVSFERFPEGGRIFTKSGAEYRMAKTNPVFPFIFEFRKVS